MLQRTDLGKELGLALRRQPEGARVLYGPKPEVYVEEAQPAIEVKGHC